MLQFQHCQKQKTEQIWDQTNSIKKKTSRKSLREEDEDDRTEDLNKN